MITVKKQTGLEKKAFSLVEMMVVISIIAVLVTMLIPTLLRAKTKARVATARQQISDIVQAINRYKSDYGQYPTPPDTYVTPGSSDFTYGTHAMTAPVTITNGFGYETNNSVLMAILMAVQTNRDGKATLNTGHFKNPRKIVYLNAKETDGNTSNPLPGVGVDGVYRDPWGQPYIITLDMSYDEFCFDPMYRRRGVSQQNGDPGSQQGHFGLFNSVTNSGHSDDFALKAPVMVWSFGPDKSADWGPSLSIPTPYPDGNAIANPNSDNVLSWR